MKNKKINYNKSIYFTILFAHIITYLVILAEVFLRFFLIDHIVYAASVPVITRDFIWIVLLFFAENMLCMFEAAVRLHVTRKCQPVMPEAVMHACERLPLRIMEQQTTQETIRSSEEYFKKSLEYTDALARWLKLGLSAGVLLWFMRNTSFVIVLVLAVLICTAFYANLRAAKNTFGFWQRYMAAARRFNYLSDLQIKREYAYERRIFDTSEAMDERFSEEFDRAARVNKKSGLARFRGQVLLESILIGITVFTMFYFAMPQTLEAITLGTYTAITEMIARVLGELSGCAESVFTIREFGGLRKELVSFLEGALSEKSVVSLTEVSSDASSDISSDTNGTVMQSENMLSLCHLNFRYEGNEKDTLEDISFTFESGKHYGLVGVNGAGKTTLAKLLLELYRPTGGSICGGAWKKTALFQDFQIYPVTVREYLLMGNDPALPDNRLLEALAMLECTDLKQGLDTPLTLLTEEGTLLSKGQLQRLAVARAFLSDADFILLDEPTASLDPVSERDVYVKSQNVLQGKTALFITHRLGAIRRMDEILVLDEGRLAEHGSHEALMRANGIYRKLYQTQKEMYVDENEQ